MKRFVITILCFLNFVLAYTQEHTLDYKNSSLIDILEDLENRFSVKFSYNSDILKGETFSYSGEATIKGFLDILKETLDLEIIFIDDENIVLKKKGSLEETAVIHNLDEVLIVTEYLTSGFDQNKKDGSINLQPARLNVLPGLTEPDVLQSLQMLPGISSPTESASNLHIRGGTPDQNLILWDGIKTYHQGHLFGMISAFNPYITEQVNVYRSGTSAKYGERISSVIDIQTTKEIPEKTTLGIGANLLHSDAFIKTPIIKNKLGVIISARNSLSNLNSITFNRISNKVFQNTRINDKNEIQEEEELNILDDTFKFTDFNIKALWQISKNSKLSISSLFINNELDYANEDNNGSIARDILNLKNNGFSMKWDKKFNPNWSFQSDIHFSNYNSFYEFNEQSLEGNSDENVIRDNQIKDSGASLHNQLKINSNNIFIFGLDYNRYRVDYNIGYGQNASIRESQSRTESVNSVYIEHQFQHKNWYIRPGIRSSLFSENTKFLVEPRLFVNYKINKALMFKASGEIKNQAISQLISFDFNYLGLNNEIWALANNDNIPILNNKQITSGLSFTKKGWKIDIEGYYKHIKGLTSLTKGFNASVTDDDYASGKSNIYGIDVLLKKRIGNFRTWLSYSLSKTDFDFNSIQNNSFPGNFDQRHSLSFSNTYKYKQFQFSVGWQYASGKPFSMPSGFETTINEEGQPEGSLIFSSQNNRRLPSYHRLDASFIYNLYLNKQKTVKARMGISVLNLYNRKNNIDKIFDLDENENSEFEIIEESVIGLRTTPNFIFRVKL
ncbi:TonB-dependent receptor plug domain-containing protein [Seonamhaeicola sp.]|uniref:TonB-dependent receptor plug domain-containing protein n=1 Tax=Seonamhaeicola sp. TaxID=1912245 RepID=UPI002628F764|nr:TonB-dependent receptor plug domain-containing protein [Seonamhaeicola sp.]